MQGKETKKQARRTWVWWPIRIWNVGAVDFVRAECVSTPREGGRSLSSLELGLEWTIVERARQEITHETVAWYLRTPVRILNVYPAARKKHIRVKREKRLSDIPSLATCEIVLWLVVAAVVTVITEGSNTAATTAVHEIRRSDGGDNYHGMVWDARWSSPSTDAADAGGRRC